MHIPDGYLSPSTCAVMYAASAPFWCVALRRVRKLLHTRLVPQLSIFSAFSFVIMMFNLPLPGGTTGHAVGLGVAAIVLGPWGGMLALSVALLIQALCFGDGGITTYGANCFNMAIAGTLAAYAVYYLLAHRAALSSPWRVIAGALAGYVGINIAALLAAIEFGVQPLLFKDAGGAPLYCPYPLSIAIPAMMLGYLTFAGMAEAVVTGGVIAYLQRTDASLLKLTAPKASTAAERSANDTRAGETLRPLWIGLALLMILTPLGTLAAGTAWGEWGPADFRNPAQRQPIAAASAAHPAPAWPPQGLERLSALWTAPIPDYAPAFLKSAPFGYMMSAMLGAGLIILVLLTLALLARKGHRDAETDKLSAAPGSG